MYSQDDSYALDRHVSASIQGLLLRRFRWPQAWATIQNMWRWAVLDSRLPTPSAERIGHSVGIRTPCAERHALRVEYLQSGRCFIDPWSASAMETMERTWPELAEAFRSPPAREGPWPGGKSQS
jgi:hypothetical protein